MKMNDAGIDVGAVVSAAEEAGEITVQHVMALRRAIFGKAKISEDEAEALLRLANSNLPAVAQWQELFLEALTDYMLNQEEPKGYVSERRAAWLIEKITENDDIDLETELQLLVRIADKATSCPESLVLFTLEAIKRAVVNDSGDLKAGIGRGSISEKEVEMLRTVLYSMGSDGGLGISRAEADILFDIHDAVADGENHPSWYDLFARAIASHLMDAAGYRAPSREEALRRQEWFEDTGISLRAFARKAFKGGLRAAFSRVESAGSVMYRRIEESIRENENISDEEAQWLVSRIMRNGKIDENERALLQIIRREAPEVSPILDALMQQAA